MVGSQSETSVVDAAGLNTFSFDALLRLLVSSTGVRMCLLHTPPLVSFTLTGLAVLLMRDLALARDEIDGLLADLLTSDAPPTGTTRLSDWLRDNADGLGRRYVSELGRNQEQEGGGKARGMGISFWARDPEPDPQIGSSRFCAVWWAHPDSNQGPTGYEPAAPPAIAAPL